MQDPLRVHQWCQHIPAPTGSPGAGAGPAPLSALLTPSIGSHRSPSTVPSRMPAAGPLAARLGPILLPLPTCTPAPRAK